MNTDTPQNITPDRLTEILHKRADGKLEVKIRNLTNPLLRQGAFVTLSDYEISKLVPNPNGGISIRNLVEVMHACLVRHDTEAARAAEVADFLAKVENIAAELDAIREEINQ
jgi:hypothetical protein